MDAFGTNETHTPTNVPALASLPVHTLGTLGGPQLALRSVDNAGHYNKLGNHRFVRFNVPNARNVTITAASNNPNNPDTDFLVYKAGVFIAAGVDGPAPTETETFQAAAGDYLLDVYDCANGCNTPDDTPEGTPGDYDLTVTIN
jgi:hypothetical protein